MRIVEAFTDGSCLGNGQKGAAGGWAFLLRYGKHEKKAHGCSKDTTNNKMELTAAIKALESIKDDAHIDKIIAHSDSQYVVKSVMDWRGGWEAKNFSKVKNVLLLKQLFTLVDKKAKEVVFEWVKGHSGHAENEIVDKLAVKAANGCK